MRRRNRSRKHRLARLLAVAGLVGAAAALSCDGKSDTDALERDRDEFLRSTVVAKVGDYLITAEELDRRMRTDQSACA